MGKITGGELLVEVLRSNGINNVFSIIGGQMCSIYDALSHAPEMKLVTLRNEAAAPMMAAGCTAITGIPSVSMCTVGAGVVYEVAGLMAAWYQYLPVISIAPQVQSWKMKPHQENLQGLNQDGVFDPITKWNAIVYHWDRIPSLTNRAIREALANAPGPVHLDAPVDILFQTKELDEHKRTMLIPEAATTRFTGSLPGPKKQVAAAWDALFKSERPLVVVGQGMGRPGRFGALKESLKRLGAPVLASDCSSGVMDARDNCYSGALRLFTKTTDGYKTIREADLLIIVGLDDEVNDLVKSLAIDGQKIVQVEVDPSALLAGKRHHIGVNADPVSFFAAGDYAEPSLARKDWLEKVKQSGAAIARSYKDGNQRLAAIFGGVSSGLKGDEVIVVDGGHVADAAAACLRDARYKHLFTMNTRDMAGVGLPFALGAKIGSPSDNLILITDKDSLFRHIQEIQTAVGLGAEIAIVCVDPGLGDAVVRTESILEGLGCRVGRIKRGDSIGRPKDSKPLALMCEE